MDRTYAPGSREQFLQEKATQANALERLARQVREGKWETLHIEETFTRDGPHRERVTVSIRASLIRKNGTALELPLDAEEKPPGRPHHFEGSWQPGEKRGDENERYEERCTACGLTIIDPSDVVDGNGVIALTPEWLELFGHPKECTDRRSGVSEQANGVPRSDEHEREHRARKA